ncbi:hypothetical protein, conserved [Eimeria tenella]|uniref:Uncharacterized protein n=1 Tax=Eimeria tenella TaxID=5802 RepID=U6KTR3_EIMTE|nr:hypothetical protein, conserved [Eimeria tenella]CDJ41487.1 hypothetical protein, conserved [Eimeria tenella]|eukprot:XP_013232237.1 hypothetical protein, conserved [Eimeria tenella]
MKNYGKLSVSPCPTAAAPRIPKLSLPAQLCGALLCLYFLSTITAAAAAKNEAEDYSLSVQIPLGPGLHGGTAPSSYGAAANLHTGNTSVALEAPEGVAATGSAVRGTKLWGVGLTLLLAFVVGGALASGAAPWKDLIKKGLKKGLGRSRATDERRQREMEKLTGVSFSEESKRLQELQALLPAASSLANVMEVPMAWVLIMQLEERMLAAATAEEAAAKGDIGALAAFAAANRKVESVYEQMEVLTNNLAAAEVEAAPHMQPVTNIEQRYLSDLKPFANQEFIEAWRTCVFHTASTAHRLLHVAATRQLQLQQQPLFQSSIDKASMQQNCNIMQSIRHTLMARSELYAATEMLEQLAVTVYQTSTAIEWEQEAAELMLKKNVAEMMVLTTLREAFQSGIKAPNDYDVPMNASLVPLELAAAKDRGLLESLLRQLNGLNGAFCVLQQQVIMLKEATDPWQIGTARHAAHKAASRIGKVLEDFTSEMQQSPAAVRTLQGRSKSAIAATAGTLDSVCKRGEHQVQQIHKVGEMIDIQSTALQAINWMPQERLKAAQKKAHSLEHEARILLQTLRNIREEADEAETVDYVLSFTEEADDISYKLSENLSSISMLHKELQLLAILQQAVVSVDRLQSKAQEMVGAEGVHHVADLLREQQAVQRDAATVLSKAHDLTAIALMASELIRSAELVHSILETVLLGPLGALPNLDLDHTRGPTVQLEEEDESSEESVVQMPKLDEADHAEEAIAEHARDAAAAAAAAARTEGSAGIPAPSGSMWRNEGITANAFAAASHNSEEEAEQDNAHPADNLTPLAEQDNVYPVGHVTPPAAAATAEPESEPTQEPTPPQEERLRLDTEQEPGSAEAPAEAASPAGETAEGLTIPGAAAPDAGNVAANATASEEAMVLPGDKREADENAGVSAETPDKAGQKKEAQQQQEEQYALQQAKLQMPAERVPASDAQEASEKLLERPLASGELGETAAEGIGGGAAAGDLQIPRFTVREYTSTGQEQPADAELPAEQQGSPERPQMGLPMQQAESVEQLGQGAAAGGAAGEAPVEENRKEE